MVQWHASGFYPSNADLKAALVAAGKKPATASVYASAILKWARSGKVPKTLYACINSNPPGHAKSAAGRPTKQGAGKTTAKKSGAAVDPLAPNNAVKDAVSPMHYWVKELNALSAGATILRNAKNDAMTAEDAVALKDAVSVALALLAKYTA
jgi:hypothetical protein